jgi:hypothetical protein
MWIVCPALTMRLTNTLPTSGAFSSTMPNICIGIVHRLMYDTGAQDTIWPLMCRMPMTSTILHA